MQRDKGARVERELVNKHLEIGVKAERVPLSGAARYKGGAHDIDVYVRGDEHAPMVAEVKARANGEGFKVLESYLGENDILFLRRNNAEPLIVLPWRSWRDLVGR
jgi:Holliday junction resolvase